MARFHSFRSSRRDMKAPLPLPVGQQPLFRNQAVLFQPAERSADPEKFAPVFPGEFAKDRGVGALFEQRRRLPSDAFAAEPRGRGIVRLTDSAAFAVLTGTIAAKDEFVLMAREKIRREFGVAR